VVVGSVVLGAVDAVIWAGMLGLDRQLNSASGAVMTKSSFSKRRGYLDLARFMIAPAMT
jgi:hypothetical protein